MAAGKFSVWIRGVKQERLISVLAQLPPNPLLESKTIEGFTH